MLGWPSIITWLANKCQIEFLTGNMEAVELVLVLVFAITSNPNQRSYL